ncbi:hypothetical protein Gohar_024196, partial [Gossypium harknessii]|nr:hypothetical protein [Gossypium harknessii]
MEIENNLEGCGVEKLATIIAIGTTNPPNRFYQADYPDFYFRLSEAMLKENPCLTIYKAPSFDVRQDIIVKEVLKLGMEAALKAIKEWGQPISKITHLIFCTSSGIDMPSADHKLANLIGLKPSVQRFMIYNQGCFTGATDLRLAKDLAENNASARVLFVCSENMIMSFQPPSETHLDILIGSAIFSNGEATLIVGANPIVSINECPLFQIYVSNNIKQCMVEAFTPFGIREWEKLFYIVHPGGVAILNGIEEKLGLNKERLRA